MNTLDLDLTKRYTYADYYSWRDDMRRELYDGFIREIPESPNTKHQTVAGNLLFIFSTFLRKKTTKAIHAPFDVRLPENSIEIADNQIYTVVQPDISVFCDSTKLEERSALGAPDLIIEIVSPKNAKRDVVEKKKLYEKHGVKEYWIVQPHDENISVFLLDANGKYQLENMYAGDDKVKVNCLDNLYIDLTEVFE